MHRGIHLQNQKQFHNQMNDYNASDEELTTTVKNFHSEFKKLVVSMLEKDVELKAIATSKEWEDISNLKKESIFNK